MATYDLAYPGAAIDAILNTAYYLQEAGYIFQGSASEYSGTPSKRVWLIAPAGFTGLGLSSAVPQGSIGICLYNGTAWVGKVINVLTLDSGPTRNSQNGVTSGGVAATLDEIAGGIMETFASLLFDDETASADLRTKLSYAVKFSVSDVYQTVTHLNILAATTSKAGLMSAEDKAKVDSFLANLRSLTFADTTASADQATQITETLKATIGGVQEVIDSITLLAATSSKAGLLSASDKAYIDALPATLTSLSNSISGALALMQSLVGYYVCDTAAGTAAKTVAATGYSLTNGGCIRIKMTNANTADNATLNINSTGAKALYYDGAQASSSNTWEAGEVLEVYYDGTQYQCASGGGGKFATGQKVGDVSISNEVTHGSDALPTSGATFDAINNNLSMRLSVVNYSPSQKMNLSGAIGFDAASAVTPYIPVNEGDTVVVERGGNTLSNQYFDQSYDSTKTRVNYLSRANSNPVTYTIASNVKYIRCNFLVSAIGTAKITVNGVVVWTAGQETMLMSEFLEGQNFNIRVNNDMNMTLPNTDYIKYDSGTSPYVAPVLPIKAGDVIKLTFSGNTTNTRLQYKDENGNGDYLVNLGANVESVTIVSPANIASIRNFSSTPISVTIENITMKDRFSMASLLDSSKLSVVAVTTKIVFTNTMHKTIFTPIKRGTILHFYDVTVSSGSGQLQFTDNNGNSSDYNIGFSNGTDKTFTAYADFVRTRMYVTNSSVKISGVLEYTQYMTVNDVLVMLMNRPLTGKKFTCLGDSITAYSYSKVGFYVNDFLDTFLTKNFAIAGSSASDRTGTVPDVSIEDGVTPGEAADNVLMNQVLKALQWTTENGAQITWTHPIAGQQSISTSVGTGLGHTDDIPDIIYIAISVNDTGSMIDADEDAVYGVLAQTYASLTRSTIASGLRWAIETLRSAYPNAFICAASPLTGGASNDYRTRAWKGKIIKMVCEYENILYIPSGEMSGYNEIVGNSGGGGLHPNATWAERIAKFVAKTIRDNYFNTAYDAQYPYHYL